jgi:3-phosphoshikimate 1-carboxyvinyltransferase
MKSMQDPRPIDTVAGINARVSVPPSKSYTNRALIVAALADGVTKLIHPSRSDDSVYLVKALRQMGVEIQELKDSFKITGTNGSPRAPEEEVFVGNAGTAMRFLTSFAALAKGETRLNGDEAMRKRPINDLLAALNAAGVKCTSENGCPPVAIHGGALAGGDISLKASVSSQFVSSILLSAPYAKKPLHLLISGKLSSLPYVDMSLHVMRTFGATVDFIEPSIYHVHTGDQYIGQEYIIEGDASAATYFFAAAAITGGKVTVNNLTADSLQGDIRFVNVMEQMGCRVTKHDDSVDVQGGHLKGFDIDMNQIPDCVPTLAVVAAFAQGPTTITNVAHLEHKETNRLKALASELGKLGARVELTDEGIIINPGKLRGADIETYNDHRMAMSFAVAGLKVPGIRIKNPGCVSKSFPDFWNEFEKLY